MCMKMKMSKEGCWFKGKFILVWGGGFTMGLLSSSSEVRSLEYPEPLNAMTVQAFA